MLGGDDEPDVGRSGAGRPISLPEPHYVSRQRRRGGDTGLVRVGRRHVLCLHGGRLREGETAAAGAPGGPPPPRWAGGKAPRPPRGPRTPPPPHRRGTPAA